MRGINILHTLYYLYCAFMGTDEKVKARAFFFGRKSSAFVCASEYRFAFMCIVYAENRQAKGLLSDFQSSQTFYLFFLFISFRFFL